MSNQYIEPNPDLVSCCKIKLLYIASVVSDILATFSWNCNVKDDFKMISFNRTIIPRVWVTSTSNPALI